MSARKTIRCIVEGRVQGVFYRATVADHARHLRLDGWARNLADGRVEVVVSGAEEAVSELAAWLWQGSPASRVDKVTVAEWTDEVPGGFRTF